MKDHDNFRPLVLFRRYTTDTRDSASLSSVIGSSIGDAGLIAEIINGAPKLGN
jgi:hypothetical protein